MGSQNPAEKLLDQAIEATFPASDPVAVEDAYAKEQRRLRRKAKERKPGDAGEAESGKEPR